MIVKCKICNGLGRISTGFLSRDEVCPTCKGAGELEIAIPSDKLIACRLCSGTGTVQLSHELFTPRQVCPACKGVGVLERPTVGTAQTGVNEVSVPQTPRLSRYDFDIAVSFAGEDRKIVQHFCGILSSKKLKVFYDEYEQVRLWGKNLYDKFDEVYRTKALCCVIFISKNYAAKVWTTHERKSAQARALQENKEYILPVRLDDTEIPGIPPTIAHVDLRNISVEELADMTIQKLEQLKKDDSTPNTGVL